MSLEDFVDSEQEIKEENSRDNSWISAGVVARIINVTRQTLGYRIRTRNLPTITGKSNEKYMRLSDAIEYAKESRAVNDFEHIRDELTRISRTQRPVHAEQSQTVKKRRGVKKIDRESLQEPIGSLPYFNSRISLREGWSREEAIKYLEQLGVTSLSLASTILENTPRHPEIVNHRKIYTYNQQEIYDSYVKSKTPKK